VHLLPTFLGKQKSRAAGRLFPMQDKYIHYVCNGMHIVTKLNANGVLISRFDRDLNGRLMRNSRHGWYLFNARGDVIACSDLRVATCYNTYKRNPQNIDRMCRLWMKENKRMRSADKDYRRDECN